MKKLFCFFVATFSLVANAAVAHDPTNPGELLPEVIKVALVSEDTDMTLGHLRRTGPFTLSANGSYYFTKTGIRYTCGSDGLFSSSEEEPSTGSRLLIIHHQGRMFGDELWQYTCSG